MVEVSNILVSILRHHGDVLLSSPIYSLLKKLYPSAKVDVYLYKDTKPMLCGHKSIDGFIEIDRKKKKNFFVESKVFLSIAKKKYDLAINLTEGDRGAVALLLSGAKLKVGVDPEKSGFFGKRSLYTHLVQKVHGLRHQVERYLDVLRVLGYHPNDTEKTLEFDTSGSDQTVLKLLKENGLTVGKYIVAHPVSRWLFKCLPEKTVASVLNHLLDKGHRVVLTSGPAKEEIQMNQKIARLCQNKVLDLSGKTTLKELGSLVKFSKLLFCVDSVPLHISSALKKDVVCCFGPTSEVNWSPWQNPNAKVITNAFSCRPCYRAGCGGSGVSDCLVLIDPSKIIQACEDLLSKKQIVEKLYNLKFSPK